MKITPQHQVDPREFFSQYGVYDQHYQVALGAHPQYKNVSKLPSSPYPADFHRKYYDSANVNVDQHLHPTPDSQQQSHNVFHQDASITLDQCLSTTAIDSPFAADVMGTMCIVAAFSLVFNMKPPPYHYLVFSPLLHRTSYSCSFLAYPSA